MNISANEMYHSCFFHTRKNIDSLVEFLKSIDKATTGDELISRRYLAAPLKKVLKIKFCFFRRVDLDTFGHLGYTFQFFNHPNTPVSQ